MSMTTPQHMLATKVANMSESETLKMAAKARELKSQGIDVISLSLGEPDFDTPDHIKEAAVDALAEGYTKYTPVTGLPEYVDAIIKKFKRDNGLEYNKKEIIVSNGAKQSISNVCQAILNDGDEVIIFTPYWVSYHDIVKLAGGVPIMLKAGIEHDFKVTPEQLEKAITHKTKAILFSSPCNPTGSVYTQADFEALAEVIKQHENIIVIADEIYEYINYTGDHASIGTIPGMKERTVTINGMSKGFAMTGWRLGYMGGPQWIIEACTKIQGQSTSGAASFSQKAAAEALLGSMKPTDNMRKEFKKRRDLVIQLLEEIPGIKINVPKGAFYAFPDISYYFGKKKGSVVIDDAADFSEYILEAAHVAIVSGDAFGDPNCVRLSYAASESSIKQAIKRIKEALEGFA